MGVRAADFILDFLAARAVDKVFLLTGGALTYVIDAFHKRSDIGYVCVRHEQAAAMAADGFSRVRPDSIGVALTTSGPGATNLLTGTGCSWFDSIPCLYISGQVNTYESRQGRSVRQVGFQEMDIVDVIAPIAKYAVRVEEANQVPCALERAYHEAKSGRPGPALLDLPMDVSRTEIDLDRAARFHPPDEAGRLRAGVDAALDQCLAWLAEARRPVILAGGGVRLASGAAGLKRLAEGAGIPVVVSLNGLDALPHDSPAYIGFIGVYGNRGANLALANADLLIAVGSRLDTRQTGTQPPSFAREARKIVVDVDANELAHHRVQVDLPVQGDAAYFLEALAAAAAKTKLPDFSVWLAQARRWSAAFPADEGRRRDGGPGVDPYAFFQSLSRVMADDDVVSLDTGQNMVWGVQSLAPRGGMRVFTAGGMSPMGYAFPAAIGASVGRGGRRAIAVNGDGGMQINIQELQTLADTGLPVKVFVANNRSLGLIRQFQDVYFEGRHEASVPGKGYGAPDFVKVAQAFGLPGVRIETEAGLDQVVRRVLETDGPVLADVAIRDRADVVPKLIVNKPIEEQSPELDPEVLRRNLIVRPYRPGG